MGRLKWVVDQFDEKFGDRITTETVRKWKDGLTKPRQEKLQKLAVILDVDPTWLYLGTQPEVTPRQQVARNASVNGAANVVAGMIELDGGRPAFPDNGNPADLTAIIKGALYNFRVILPGRRRRHGHGRPRSRRSHCIGAGAGRLQFRCLRVDR